MIGEIGEQSLERRVSRKRINNILSELQELDSNSRRLQRFLRFERQGNSRSR